MEREVHLSNDFRVNVDVNDLKKIEKKKLKHCLKNIIYNPYWYQGFACRGKPMIMKLRQTFAWFSDKGCPYSSTVVPANALRLTSIESNEWPSELNELRNKLQTKYGQIFNSLSVECFDPRETKNNSMPFKSCAFAKKKETWVTTNTNICVIPIGHSVPKTCKWETKELMKDEKKDKRFNKYVVAQENDFKDKILTFGCQNEKE